MLVQNHYPDGLVTPPSLSLIAAAWTTDVVPRVPANRAEQARGLKAFQRVRGLATPHDLWRGLLAYGLGPLSTRRRGAWAGRIGLAAISAAAGRKRLRTSNAWRLWRRSVRGAGATPPTPAVPRPVGRLWLVDASGLPQPGGTGDDGRVPLAYAFLGGRMRQGQVTDRRGGARLERYPWRPGAVIGADNGAGDRRRVAWAVPQRAEVVVRRSPAPLPLDTEAGPPCNVRRWRRPRGSPEREWRGWCPGQGQRYRGRRLAATLEAPATQRARCRRRRPAQNAGRTMTAPPLAVAGGRWLITTLAATTGSAADVL